MKEFDVIAVGNTMLDEFLSIRDADNFMSLNANQSQLCIRYGEKIHVSESKFLIGGNASNVAVGLCRLGFSAALCAETGDDEFAEKIERGLLAERVNLDLFKKTKGEVTSFSVGLNFKGERTLFVKHEERHHEFSFSAMSTKWVYLTSLGREWKALYRKVIELVNQDNIRLAFSPGTHQLDDWGEEAELAVKRADILFLNKEEGKRVLVWCGKEGTNQMPRMLSLLQGLGPKTVVVTDGKRGSFVRSAEGNMYSLAIFPSEIVERTGAGDAYASGFLAATMNGKPLDEAMRWGTANAASVITRVGAQPGLLKKEEMEELLNRYQNILVQTLA